MIRYLLLIFILSEVFLYGPSSGGQTIFAFLFYAFILVTFLLDKKKGIEYYLYFTLLSFGKWSYINSDMQPNNFWGIDIAGISVNVLFNFGLAAFLVMGRSGKIDSGFIKSLKFVYVYLLCIFFVGLFYLNLGINYPDDFISNLFVLLPIVSSIVLVSIFNYNELIMIVKRGFILTAISFWLSFLSGIKFEYSSNLYFLLINSFAFILPFSIFFMKKYFTKAEYIFLVGTVVLFLGLGEIFLSGKLIIILFLTLVWLSYSNRHKIWVLSLSALTLVLVPALSFFLQEYFEGNVLIQWKFQQTNDGISNLDNLIYLEGSFGNIIAEGYCIIVNFWSNISYLILGKGIGGGIPDQFNLLSDLAGAGGYKIADAQRNNFFTMHISFLEIVVKGGFVFGFLFLRWCYGFFKSNKIFSFISFILLFTVFYTSKEMILITLITIRITYLEKNESTLYIN